MGGNLRGLGFLEFSASNVVWAMQWRPVRKVRAQAYDKQLNLQD